MEFKQVKWNDHGPTVVEVIPSAENGAFASGTGMRARIGNLVLIHGVGHAKARALENDAASLEECGIRALLEQPGAFMLDDRLSGYIKYPNGAMVCHDNVILEFDPHIPEA